MKVKTGKNNMAFSKADIKLALALEKLQLGDM